MLLKEVGKNGNGSATEVEHWIEQGANPDLRNKDNVPVLHIAVQNKRIEAIPSLVNSGADINIRGPKCVHLAFVTPCLENKCSFIFHFSRGNTALHEAVIMGSSARDVIDVLLE